MKKLRVIVACEESQIVCKAFRALGHEAYSCDIQECSGGHPEWHYQEDIFEVLKREPKFDLMIAHPPCTYLCISGQKFCNIDVYGDAALKRIKERGKAVDFFIRLSEVDIEHIAIENPVGVIPRYFRKADQFIKPLQFGHPVKKQTGLWLKNLPKLIPTNIVDQEFHISGTGRKWDKWFWDSSMIGNLKERSKFRSKTFQGIANAMASQWSEYILKILAES